MAWYPKLLIVAMLCPSASCAQPHQNINDLRFESIHVVNVVNDAKDSRLPQEVDSPRNGTTRLLKIRFTTRVDLAKFAKRTEFNIGSEVTICNSRDGKPVQVGGGRIYQTGVQVGMYPVESSDSATSHQAIRSPIHRSYDVYASIKQSQASAGATFSPAFDVSASPADLCLRLSGGDMRGATFTSNVIVIKQQDLTRALGSWKK